MKFIPDWYKTQEMYMKAVNTDLSTIKYVPDWYKTKDTCVEAVNTYYFVLDSVLNPFKSQ